MIYIQYTFEGLTPSKKNSRISTRSGRTFPSKAYQEWHRTALEALSLQVYPDVALPITRAGIEVHMTFGTKRRCDLSNKFESIADTLVDAGILEDDSWQILNPVYIQGKYEKGVERTIVTLAVFEAIDIQNEHDEMVDRIAGANI